MRAALCMFILFRYIVVRTVSDIRFTNVASLRNIYKELQQEYPDTFVPPKHGCLLHWARQGVFLLNAVLTVRKGEANSHNGKGE